MTIFQIPNAQLIIAVIGYLLDKFTSGAVQKTGFMVYILAITVWSYLEITQGVSLFRKILGGVVMIITAINLFNRL